MKRILLCLMFALITSGCSKIEKKVIDIDTKPSGAKILISEYDERTGKDVKKELGTSPVQYEIAIPEFARYSSAMPNDDEDDFSLASTHTKERTRRPKYVVKAQKDGYFTEEKAIVNYDYLFKSGRFRLVLEKSPMWWATSESPATNQWINLIINPEITPMEMWQRVVDAVTKRFPELKEYDYNSGYLVTEFKKKSFKTSRGTFLLRAKFIATVMETNPLTYRMKLVSEWSDQEESKWHPYPRVFIEDAQLIEELMERFQAF